MGRSSAATGLHREPFSTWLDQLVPRLGGRQEAADRLGMDEGSIRRLEDGSRTSSWMGVDTADRFFTAAGEPHQLAILYPLDEPMHNRWCETCHDVVTTNDDLLCPWCEEETRP